MNAYAQRFMHSEKKLSKRHGICRTIWKREHISFVEILTGLICLQEDEEEREFT